ncbi:hypothetical protein [Paenibacillus monticola]|uniref:Uncharacterized protein n=1 Tax=Paenibacillus monticola TaxID=2666075 RepID=A0A7X2L4E7_9BACL|nr:hypothetical protein [Paenibacillus monticola]MRN56394.1 hypothetical protein [Paenibacillus monticola]
MEPPEPLISGLAVIFFVLFGADLGRTGIMRYNVGVGYDKTEELIL